MERFPDGGERNIVDQGGLRSCRGVNFVLGGKSKDKDTGPRGLSFGRESEVSTVTSRVTVPTQKG